ncbi:MAG: DVU0524 family FlgM-associated protein [Desulfovibrionales bacterium]
MTINSLLVKNVLQTYGRQLGSARRLARFSQAMQQAGTEDAVTLSREARRKQMVERIAREIVDNLLVSGSSNPVVQEIKDELNQDFDEQFLFSYSPTRGELDILKKVDSTMVRIEGRERETVLARLWALTLEKVDETMI